jgi:serine/threonine protein kinase/tetratricopeptide (TPR) repeat protein
MKPGHARAGGPANDRSMRLSISQMAVMSRLLDEALPLDAAGRRVWLDALSAEYRDLTPALREALLPEEGEAARVKAFTTLPKLGFDDAAGVAAASGLQAGARIGPYALIRRLGAGGMAEVWLARRADGAFKRETALKLPTLSRVRADLSQRFARECDILASLEHPHIARLYDAGVDSNGLPYLSMEYVQGRLLTDWCDAHRLGIAARLELFLQVLEAVQYAHEKQVIHRDLKPSNILVTEDGQVRLLDFGVAKLLEADEAQLTQLTDVYGRALTPDYASPELLRGNPIDARSDIYSLGVLLYEILTGVRPYGLKSAASIGVLEQAIANVNVEKPSTRSDHEAIAARGTTPERLNRQLRGDLDAIALKALAKEPAKRYPSAGALAEDLRRYLGGKPIEALPARFTDRLHKLVRRNKFVVGVTAAAVAAIIAAVGFTTHRERVKPATITANAAPKWTNTTKPVSDKSIAVLPFLDLSERRDQEYFSDGLSEELIELLGKTEGLQVIARTSSFYFKGKTEMLETIGEDLKVANVLEGSVRKSGNRLRVTAQLIRVATSEHIWSETFDRDLTDVFKVQDEIAGAVVAALKLHLLSTESPAARDELRTGNIEAYNQYLRGKESYNHGDQDGYRRAVKAFSAATALDPGYAAAFAGLALAQFWLADATNDIAGYETALAAAHNAVALAPGLAAGYSARGFLRGAYRFDTSGARADLDRAVALRPGDAEVLHRSAIMFAMVGDLRTAIARERNALALDPLSAEICMRLAFFLVADHQFAQARPLYEKALAIAPNSVRARYNLGNLEMLENRPVKALASFRQTETQVWRLTGQARAEYSLGHADASQRILEQLIVEFGKTDPATIATVYAWRGERDQAFMWAERASAQRDTGLTWIKIDPVFSSLRSDSRYEALLHEMNLPE